MVNNAFICRALSAPFAFYLISYFSHEAFELTSSFLDEEAAWPSNTPREYSAAY